jgi:hypothetical protein
MGRTVHPVPGPGGSSVRTPEIPVAPIASHWGLGDDALGECSDCADVVLYEPERLSPGRPLLCAACGLAALGLSGF